MLHSSPFYTLSLCFSVSFSFSLTYNLFPKSHLDGVYVPPQVQYSMYKDGEEAALMVAEEEEDTTWAQQGERGLNEAKPLDAFFNMGPVFHIH